MDNSTALKKTNKAVLTANVISNIVILLGYLNEVIQGGRTLLYTLGIILISSGPLVYAIIKYQKDNSDKNLKYITLGGYLLMYTVALFTSQRNMVFTYIFPILLIYFLYFDLKLIKITCAIVIVLNVARIIFAITVLKLTQEGVATEYIIQIAVVFLYCFCIILSTKVSNVLNSEKIKTIEKEKEKQEVLLSDILKTANVLDENSNEVFKIVNSFADSTILINDALGKISEGTIDTTKRVNQQAELTQNIDGVIRETSNTSKEIDKISRETTEIIKAGITTVDDLNEKAIFLGEDNERVYNTIIELKDTAKEISKITEVIRSIASKISLLALNAAIESARAGEAGKGFAVVADEIRKLSIQSSSSAENIKKTIEKLNKKSTDSVEAIARFKDVFEEQNALIKNTHDVFSSITSKTLKLSENIDGVNTKVNSVVNENDKIVENIESISSVCNEVSSSIQEIVARANENIQDANKAKKFVSELVETSKKMNKYTK